MDTLIPLLREKQRIRNVERSRFESRQAREHVARRAELEELRDQTRKCDETIVKNLNSIAGHRHALNKVVNESSHTDGLPISHKHHKETLDFLNDAFAFMNNKSNLDLKPSAENSIDSCKLSKDVQTCTQSSSDVLKAMQSSVVKIETLMQNLHVIADRYNDDEPGLDRSIFDE